jgi:hypothetical protein
MLILIFFKKGLHNPIFGFQKLVYPFGDSLAQKQDFSKYAQSSIYSC